MHEVPTRTLVIVTVSDTTRRARRTLTSRSKRGVLDAAVPTPRTIAMSIYPAIFFTHAPDIPSRTVPTPATCLAALALDRPALGEDTTVASTGSADPCSASLTNSPVSTHILDMTHLMRPQHQSRGRPVAMSPPQPRSTASRIAGPQNCLTSAHKKGRRGRKCLMPFERLR
ncbi:uncharacterized protein C8Q71DRAFT_743041 [Rhodofomes roseus]|uniref:Uncharacterized protein n=1 Tax=Rhodofomes roseus TaxID=34475 RepID=A0ABQ8KR00_9APHY|nr:uncharacterized protein C8Q71DRAFT_743041 [Rhodofomes roseus]KAH9841054.1 hypothetical protein C8Q71DRAFT_743041 [Rhodofomes roseus]